jgi:hypothetical protein
MEVREQTKIIALWTVFWVCKVVCVKGELLHRKPLFKFNRKTIQSGFPISNRH